MLAFEPEDCGHLANQVSVWLESDLPTYHWFMKVPGARIHKYFDNLLKGVRRMVYDGSLEQSDLRSLDWPQPERVRDLAQARLLPIRQSLGQFLSGFPIEGLLDGLTGIRLGYAPERKGEAVRLAEWLESCLGGRFKIQTGLFEAASPQAEPLQLNMLWDYADDRYLKWELYCEGERARFDFKFGAEAKSFMTQLKPLAPEQALAEALFF